MLATIRDRCCGVTRYFQVLLSRGCQVHFRGAFIRLALVLAACFFLAAPSAREAQTSNVLVLFSNNRLFANIEVYWGFRETIANSTDRNVEVFAEFLDVPAFTGEAYEQSFATYLRGKYATHPHLCNRPLSSRASPHSIFAAPTSCPVFPGRTGGPPLDRQAHLQSIPPLPPDVVGVPGPVPRDRNR